MGFLDGLALGMIVSLIIILIYNCYQSTVEWWEKSKSKVQDREEKCTK